MPNLTISVPDDLKAEMDEFPEVSWSEICRKAISGYISERKHPTPAIELDLRDVRLDTYHASGYPTLTATLRIHNKMNTDVIVDRILFDVRFASNERQYNVGLSFDLSKIIVSSNSVGETQLFLPIFREKIEYLADKFTSTFPCMINCIVVANGFKNPYNQEVRAEIPIDKWKEFTKRALEPQPK
jgi:hypothetical protein